MKKKKKNKFSMYQISFTKLTTIILVLSLSLLNTVKAQKVNVLGCDSFSSLTHLDAQLMCFIIPPCAIDVELNKLIRENFTSEERKNLYIGVDGVKIKLRKSGRVKKVYWEDIDRQSSERIKFIKLVSKYFKNLKYYNNAYRDKEGNTMKVRNTFFIFRIDSSGVLRNHMWNCCYSR